MNKYDNDVMLEFSFAPNGTPSPNTVLCSVKFKRKQSATSGVVSFRGTGEAYAVLFWGLAKDSVNEKHTPIHVPYAILFRILSKEIHL